MREEPEVAKIDYDRIGERMHVELINLTYEGDKAAYVELVKKAGGVRAQKRDTRVPLHRDGSRSPLRSVRQESPF
jgi:hypothetical protein